MKKLISILLMIILSSILYADSENLFIGEWSFGYVTFEGEEIENAGSIVFFEKMHLEISTNKSTSRYDYNIDENILFINALGYYWEVIDENFIKLISAFESDSRYIILKKN